MRSNPPTGVRGIELEVAETVLSHKSNDFLIPLGYISWQSSWESSMSRVEVGEDSGHSNGGGISQKAE